MKTKAVSALLILLLAGCADSTGWEERTIPTTDAERVAVATMTEKILGATPTTLSGHDQDWDDAIKAAHTAACKTCCRPTYWEWREHDWLPTGRWRYADAPQGTTP